MSRVGSFRKIYEKVRDFNRNLTKDNQQRRVDLKTNNSKLLELDGIEIEFNSLREEFNNAKDKTELTQVKDYVESIKQIIAEIRKTLDDRRRHIAEILENKVNIMGEKFDLKTASSLLPILNNTEDSVKQLIDAIELYDSLLDNEGKILLTKFVLKTKLTQNAKLRLETSYVNNNDLIKDMKNNLLAKHSPTALSVELHNARQNEKSVDEFGRTIEELLVNLTIAQSDGNNDVLKILRGTNEKIAINSFANGLRNNDLRTVIKARNYSKLSDAISGAKDEEVAKRTPSSSQVFHMRGKNKYFRGRYTGTGNKQNSNYRQNSCQRSQYVNSNYRRNTQGSRFTRGSTRGHNYNKNFTQRNYYAENLVDNNSGPSDTNQKFFRSQQ